MRDISIKDMAAELVKDLRADLVYRRAEVENMNMEIRALEEMLELLSFSEVGFDVVFGATLVDEGRRLTAPLRDRSAA